MIKRRKCILGGFVIMLMMLCMLISTTTFAAEDDTETGVEYETVFSYNGCAAKGETITIKASKSKKAKVKIVEEKGFKCTVKKNIIYAKCNKTGSITYTVNGKNEETINIYVYSGVKKSEYKMAEKESIGKTKYSDFFKYAKAYMKKEGWNGIYFKLDKKKDINKYHKINKGLGYGSTEKEIRKKYKKYTLYSKYDNDYGEVLETPYYYDKDTKMTAIKSFAFDKKGKVIGLKYEFYPNARPLPGWE